MRTGDESYDYSLQRSLRDKFNNLFYVLGHCPESEQEQKIEELNEIIDEMDGSAIHWTFTKDLFNKMDKMIEEKKLSMENAIVLLKHLGHRAVLVGYLCSKLRDSSLRKRIEKMIIEENEKKEGRKEKLMIDLCESYLLLSATEIFEELFPISVPCLLNVALKKEGNEKTQKEVEVALLALSCIDKYEKIEKEMYFDHIVAIVKYHQEHHNMTQLAYQSTWQFLISRVYYDDSLEDAVLKELHFVRGATRELEDLTGSINWKKTSKEMSREEIKRVHITKKWIKAIEELIDCGALQKGENISALITLITRICAASIRNQFQFFGDCLHMFLKMMKNIRHIDYLVEGGTVELFLKEMNRSNVMDYPIQRYFEFFRKLCEMVDYEQRVESDEAVRKKAKGKLFEKMEEEGYEDSIMGFRHCIVEDLFSSEFLIKNIENYIIYC